MPTFRRIVEEEWIDRPGTPPEVLQRTLDDLRRINRWLGGIYLTFTGLRSLVGEELPARLSLLDVATGGADVPRALHDRAARRGAELRAVGIDLSPEILGLVPAHPAVELAVADARRLPFPDDAFDVATCSLTLHHLEPDDAVVMLAEMARTARRGIVVNDLVRARHSYLAARWLLPLVTFNPITRHDAPASVRRSYTRDEMRRMAAAAGLRRVRFHGLLGYRVAMVAESA